MIKINFMNTKFYSYIFIAVLSFTFFTCEKDDPLPPQSQAMFTASAMEVAVGEEIQFSNEGRQAIGHHRILGQASE